MPMTNLMTKSHDFERNTVFAAPKGWVGKIAEAAMASDKGALVIPFAANLHALPVSSLWRL